MRFTVYLIIISSTLFFTKNINAQQGAYYSKAIGARFGSPVGATFKYFISNQGAIEGIAGYNWSGWNDTGGMYLSGLYEQHFTIDAVEGLQFFVGAGVSLYNWSNKAKSYFAISVDVIGGIDYKIPKYPINLSLDWKPAIFISGWSGFNGSGGAFSVRYTF